MADFKSFGEASAEMATRFLESVVVIDDRADYGSLPANGTSIKEGSPPDGGEVAQVGGLVTPPASAIAAARNGHELDAKGLVDAFAERGLVCAVLKPTETEDARPRTVAASRRSDIVVIDWYLHDESGDASLRLLDGILQSDEGDNNRGRLRLVAIYTGEGRLHAIQDRVAERLDRHYSGYSLRRRGHFAVEKGPVRIVIYAKPGARIPKQQPATRRRRVDFTALPDKLIGDFAEMTSGLVPHVCLVSIAAVRSGTHRMLTTLHRGLDPAYLWHRAMQGRPADAEDHLVELVAGEVRGILDDADAGGAANAEQIQLWLKAQRPTMNYGERFSVPTNPQLEDVVRLLDDGVDSPASQSMFPSLRRDPPATIRAFAATSEAGTRANSELAILMSMRTLYIRRTPRLTLGTILASGSGANRKYWLSMQPRCDSVRLTANQNFPLIPLEPITVPTRKFGLVLKANATTYLRLKPSVKPSDLSMVAFAVPAGNDTVGAEPRGRGFAFRTTNGRWFQWMGELKFEPAQRMVERVAAEFSRVGLTESEWLRRWTAG